MRLHCNESPFAPSSKAVASVVANIREMHRYPHSVRDSVTIEVARKYEVAPGSVLLTNGVDEAVDLLLSLVDSAWLTVPGFSGYEERVRLRGCTLRHIPLDSSWEPTISPRIIADGGAVLLAQPNNPTGNIFCSQWITDVIANAELTFIDETYQDFAAAPSCLTLHHGSSARLVIFKSFSKGYGLAGIRVGSIIASPPLVRVLRERQGFQSVDSIALWALSGTLRDPEYLEAVRHRILIGRPCYAAALRSSMIFTEVQETQTNFVVARCQQKTSSKLVTDELRKQRILVKDCTDLGLAGWIRVSVGTDRELGLLTAALKRVEVRLFNETGVP